MSLFKREQPPAQILEGVCRSLVLLETKERSCVGFLAGDERRIATNLHMIASAESITARLFDGSRLPVREVVSLDTNRDLAILAFPGAPPGLPLDLRLRPAAGDRALALLPGAQGDWTPFEVTVASEQVLNEWLTVLELSRTIPEQASGGPLLDQRGRVIGVATVARADGRPVTLGMPCRYLAPLLSAPGGLTLDSLGLASGGAPRHVPHLPLALLEDASAVGLELTAVALTEAIRLGAAAYNQGHVTACANIYEQVARYLVRERADCPGVQSALRDGLSRIALEESADRRAWSMRDTFDGVLDVVERWFRAQASLALGSSAPSAPN
jgi:hypothetical protein